LSDVFFELNGAAMRSFTMLIAFFLIGGSLSAQQKEDFAGEVDIGNGKKAFAEFSYVQSKNAKTLDGRYKLKKSDIDSSNNFSSSQETWEGTFQQNKRNGKWTFESWEHQLQVKGIEEYKVNFGLQSIDRKLEGRYLLGTPDGAWRYTANYVVDGKQEKELADADFTFVDGRVRRIRFDSQTDTLAFSFSGQVNESGFLDSLWVFNYQRDSVKVQETRMYRSGFLVFLTKINTSSNDTIISLHFEDVRTKLSLFEEQDDAPRIAISSRHFPVQFDHGYPSYFPSAREQQPAGDLLDRALSRLVVLDTALNRSNNFVFATARFEYTPTERETTSINLIRYHFDSLQSYMKLFDENRVFKINEQLSDSLAWINSFVKQHSARLTDMTHLVDAMGESAFRYKNVVIFAEAFSPLLPPNDEIDYLFGGERKSFSIDYQEQYSASLSSLEARLRTDLHMIAGFFSYAESKLSEVNRNEQLVQMDQLILGSKATADSVFKYTSPVHAESMPILNKLRYSFLEAGYMSLLQRYNAEKSFDEKLNLGYSILQSLLVASTLPTQIDHIFESQKEVEGAYTVVKMDPYTFNYDFKTQRKKRIFDKGAVELFKFYMSELQNESDYIKVKSHLSDIRKLHERLHELLEEDTERLEKKLKSESEPLKIKQLLSL